MEDLNIDVPEICRELELEFLNRLCIKYQEDCLYMARGLSLRHYKKSYNMLTLQEKKRIWLLAQDIVSEQYREHHQSRL